MGTGGDASCCFPLRHGVRPMEMGGKGGVAGMRPNEEIANGGEGGNELLQASRQSKALHRLLALSQRDMRILGPVVEAFVRAMLDRRHDLTSRRLGFLRRRRWA